MRLASSYNIKRFTHDGGQIAWPKSVGRQKFPTQRYCIGVEMRMTDSQDKVKMREGMTDFGTYDVPVAVTRW